MDWPARCPSAASVPAARPRDGSPPVASAWAGRSYAIRNFRPRNDTDIAVDGVPLAPAQRCYVALNKPRGLVTTTTDERGRDTVYRMFRRSVAAVAGAGRAPGQGERRAAAVLQRPAMGRAVTDPARGPDKTYHVQVDAIPDEALLAALVAGCRRRRRTAARGLGATAARGRKERLAGNRARRRSQPPDPPAAAALAMSACCGWCVWRSVPLALGDLPKGAWRLLDEPEIRALVAAR